MKTIRYSRQFGPLALAGVLAGLSACGAATPSKELVAARSAYDAASQGKANKLVPDKVLTAKQALDRAEAAFKNDPGSFKERSLAYVAERKAEIADALAEQAEAKASMGQANENYKAEQDRLRLAEKKKAEATAKALEENQRHLKEVRDKLAQQGTKLDAAGKALKKQEAELAARKKELEAEQAALKTEHAAREEAEKKYKAAMASLQEMAKVQQDQRGMVITLSGAVLFTTGKADLLPIAQDKLEKVATVLQEQDPSKKIVVYGYTDSIGTKANNQKLSQARAETVRNFLVQKGVDSSRISAVGKGEDDPVATNKTPEGRANNRRVEIVVH
jgi:outer membrane protein OmpA-like peptidoglycan-associated protein